MSSEKREKLSKWDGSHRIDHKRVDRQLAKMTSFYTSLWAVKYKCMLTAAYTAEEITTVLFQMWPTKAPGRDGFPAHFFQRHRDICGTKVTNIIMRILCGDESLTMLFLVPDVIERTQLSQFRAISLCNILYKTASKVISNRLKQILSEITLEEQATFVPGRLITIIS